MIFKNTSYIAINIVIIAMEGWILKNERKSHFLPLSTQDFEIYRIGSNIPKHVLLNKHNETGHTTTSTETFFQLHSHDVFEF